MYIDVFHPGKAISIQYKNAEHLEEFNSLNTEEVREYIKRVIHNNLYKNILNSIPKGGIEKAISNPNFVLTFIDGTLKIDHISKINWKVCKFMNHFYIPRLTNINSRAPTELKEYSIHPHRKDYEEEDEYTENVGSLYIQTLNNSASEGIVIKRLNSSPLFYNVIHKKYKCIKYAIAGRTNGGLDVNFSWTITNGNYDFNLSFKNSSSYVLWSNNSISQDCTYSIPLRNSYVYTRILRNHESAYTNALRLLKDGEGIIKQVWGIKINQAFSTNIIYPVNIC